MKISELGRPIVGHRHGGEPVRESDHFILCPTVELDS